MLLWPTWINHQVVVIIQWINHLHIINWIWFLKKMVATCWQIDTHTNMAVVGVQALIIQCTEGHQTSMHSQMSWCWYDIQLSFHTQKWNINTKTCTLCVINATQSCPSLPYFWSLALHEWYPQNKLYPPLKPILIMKFPMEYQYPLMWRLFLLSGI